MYIRNQWCPPDGSDMLILHHGLIHDVKNLKFNKQHGEKSCQKLLVLIHVMRMNKIKDEPNGTYKKIKTPEMSFSR